MTRANRYALVTVILCVIVLLTAWKWPWIAIPAFTSALLYAWAWRAAERAEADE